MNFVQKQIIERLNANTLINARIIFYRPPTTEKDEYMFDQTFIIYDENTYWKWINRLTNWNYEYEVLEIQIPAKLVKKENRLETYKYTGK